MTDATPVPDRRETPRVQADDAATILFPNGRTHLPCRLLDRSPAGVKINVSASAQLPGEFILIFGTPETRMVCRIAWRIGSQTGCEFIPQYSEVGNPGDWAMPIAPERAQKIIKSRVLKRPLIVS